MNLKSTVLWSSIATVIRMLSGVISIKVSAYVIGPTGVAYVGQFQSFLAIVNNGSNLGIGQGTIKYLAEYKEEKEKYQKVLSTSFILTVVASSIIALLILLYYQEIGYYLFKTNEFNFVLVALSLTLVLFSTGQIITHALNGFQEIKKLIRARMLTSILGLLTTVLLVVVAGIYGALLGLILSQIVGFGILIFYAKTSQWWKRANFLYGCDKEMMRKLASFSAMALISIILLNGRQIYLRDYIIVHLSPDAAGYWQAIWKVSEMYLSVITFSLSVYYLPKLSSIKDQKLLREEIIKAYRFLLPVVVVCSLGIYVTRDLIILILFTAEFEAVRDLFFYQLIGDVFKIASWLLSFLMIAKAMTKTFIITEVVFIILFAGLALWGVHNYGLIGMTYAFAITYAIYFFTMIILFKDILLPKN